MEVDKPVLLEHFVHTVFTVKAQNVDTPVLFSDNAPLLPENSIYKGCDV